MSDTQDSTPGDVVSFNSSYEKLLQDVIRKHSKDANITVKVKEVQDVVPLGENYLSSLLRVFLEVSKDDQTLEEKVLIVKNLPKGELVQQFIKEQGIFQLEILMYKKILPQMNRILSDVLRTSTFGAYCFDTDEDNLLVLEDLKLAGYKMANRQIGLDFDHCKIALKSLARFHGISVSLVEADESVFDSLPENIFREEKIDHLKKFCRPQYEAVSEMVEAWPGFERFGAKLRDNCLTVVEKIVQLNDPNNTKIPVLNHGDFWLNNMLFKYSDSGEVEDFKMLDFQMSRFVSPAIDINYFLVTSTNDEVRKEGFQKPLEIYHSEFCRVLEALGCGHKIVTFDRFEEEIKDKLMYSLYIACTLLPVVVSTRDDVFDFSELKDESFMQEKQSEVYKNLKGATYRRLLQDLLPTYEKEGLL